MSKTTNPTRTDHGQNTDQCDRCGGERPADPDRLTITFDDRHDGTLAREEQLVCLDCWFAVRDIARRCVA